MKKRIYTAVLICALMLTGCTKKSTKQNTSPHNVVACSRSLGEMWMLSGGKLAGITDDGKDLGQKIKVVGTLMRPSVEEIIALKPSLVLLTGDIPTQQKVKKSLLDAHVKVKSVNVDNFQDYDKYMKEFTKMNKRSDLYEKNVVDVSKRIEAIKKKVNFKKQTYLMLRVSSMKNKVLKNDYFACEIANDMNMVNIAQDDSALDDINAEEIMKKDPDYIFVVYQGEEKQAQEAYNKIAAMPGWDQLSALKNKHVKVLPKNYFQFKPNAKWDKAYQYLYDYLA
ncbi:iron complex transport system substrate-binding protein [Sharpea azabuensis]|uniref:ABC transporter substrate-binding protein n=1 Tax=Sharpea azabuensis TaxID=322505 RepID=UPI0008ECD6FC|nr:ABC transporter substrate-binding protein [Sharpea azabuensis]SFD49861.1 iron complex transport system substrate-binding protein [Sharpea azabuensis]SFK51224.1 iron complex transport system substrate-binding protein [Sharpea azabuensis]